jgi:hypothetical protein
LATRAGDTFWTDVPDPTRIVFRFASSRNARRYEQRFERALTEREKSKSEDSALDAHDLGVEHHFSTSEGSHFELHDLADGSAGVSAHGGAADRHVHGANRDSLSADDDPRRCVERSSAMNASFAPGRCRLGHPKTLIARGGKAGNVPNWRQRRDLQLPISGCRAG